MSQSSESSIYKNIIIASQKLCSPVGQNLTSASSRTLIPTTGALAYDTSTELLYVGTSSEWVEAKGAGPCSVIINEYQTQYIGVGITGATGAASGQRFYFGTIGSPDSPSGIIGPIMYQNNIQQVEVDATLYTGLGILPGWRVPTTGKYKLSIIVTVGGNVSEIIPPPEGYLGKSISAKLSFMAKYFLASNIGNQSLIIAQLYRYWDGTTIPNAGYTLEQLVGEAIIDVVAGDSVIALIETTHTNSGETLSGWYMELTKI